MITSICHKWRITSKDIELFAGIVGDSNPVHTDPVFAARTRFKSPIAHGMTALVLLNHALPKKYLIAEMSIRFMKPIYAGYELSSQLSID